MDLESIKRQQEGYGVGLPTNCQNLYVKASRGKVSPRQAIKAQCQQCVGYENISEAVRDCQGFTCPLYEYRPYK